MALTLTTDSVNASCNAVVDLIDAESPTAGKLYIYGAGYSPLLVTITLGDPAFGAASSGVATANGLPLSGTAVADGTAALFEVVDGDDDVIFEGTVGGTAEATSGDLQLNSSTIVTDDLITITAFTFTAPTS